jgi:hypothetical protein
VLLNSHALTKIATIYEDALRWSKCDSHVLYVDDENLDREISDVMKFLGLKNKCLMCDGSGMRIANDSLAKHVYNCGYCRGTGVAR